MKDPITGQFETQDIEIEGPVSYVETTTKTHIHPENETRCFDLHVDESEKQTERIHKAQNRKHEIMALDKKSILIPWRNAQRLLETYPVCIPYINLIKFPTKPLRVRRDRLRFIALIETSALLFQNKREKKIINGKKFVVADIEDYTIAYSLIEKILESVLKGLSPKIKKLVKIAKDFNGREFQRKDLHEKVKWNRKTLEDHIKEAVEWGYFKITQYGSPGKPYKYKLIKTDDVPIGLLSPDELKDEMPTLSSNVQLGGGHFKPAPILDKLANDQFAQRETRGEGI